MSRQDSHIPAARAARLSIASWLLLSAWPMLSRTADAPAPAVVSQQQIEQALKKAPPTRGLRIQGAAEPKRAIDLNIPFDFNSSDLQLPATAQLKVLQSALTSDALTKDRFLIAGHTDAKGNAQYNHQLSQRRAEAVRRYLIANGVAASRLDAVGKGADELLTPDRPEDAANRRVEIRNLGEGP